MIASLRKLFFIIVQYLTFAFFGTCILLYSFFLVSTITRAIFGQINYEPLFLFLFAYTVVLLISIGCYTLYSAFYKKPPPVKPFLLATLAATLPAIFISFLFAIEWNNYLPVSELLSMKNTLLSLAQRIDELPKFLGLGLCMIVGMVVIGVSLNKIMVHLLIGHEVTTFGRVDTPPKLTKQQVSLLKEILTWWNYQCDRWYTTEAIAVDKALKGIELNMVDVQRLRASTQVGDMLKKISKKDQAAFNKLDEALAITQEKLAYEINYKKMHEKAIDEQDIVTKQLKASQYSALAAVASSVAAIASCFLAYVSYTSAGH